MWPSNYLFWKRSILIGLISINIFLTMPLEDFSRLAICWGLDGFLAIEEVHNLSACSGKNN
ncbi:MAG: hypothetical protein DRJ11_02530 [Candidatus Aminicenantes bacterium]|nr:MAG: hypothetical protein DRJ11_02530 [Candidatus Aminicenantes bacterium]